MTETCVTISECMNETVTLYFSETIKYLFYYLFLSPLASWMCRMCLVIGHLGFM